MALPSATGAEEPKASEGALPLALAEVSVARSEEAGALLKWLGGLTPAPRLWGEHGTLAKAVQSRGQGPGAWWEGDWGYSDASVPEQDRALRPELRAALENADAEGAVVAVTLRFAHPVLGEPCTAAGLQGELTPGQAKELLTPGTPLNQAWRKQVAALADFLRPLEREKVPVVLRPFPGMNEGRYWWGAPGRSREAVMLWRLLHRQLTERHRLTHLLWLWSPSAETAQGLEEWYPGDDYVDLFGLSVDRGEQITPALAERWQRLANGRPRVLYVGEGAGASWVVAEAGVTVVVVPRGSPPPEGDRKGRSAVAHSRGAATP